MNNEKSENCGNQIKNSGLSALYSGEIFDTRRVEVIASFFTAVRINQ